MNMWMIGRNLMEQHYLKKKSFIIIRIWKKLQMWITCMEKEFVKTLFKNLGEYHDLYLRSDAFYFWQMFLKTLEKRV